MAEKNYLVNEEISLGYQAPNAESGLSGVVAKVYRPNKTLFGTISLTEDISNTGNYIGTFTPDVQGTWRVIMHKSDGDGQLPKAYSVGAHNVHSVGEKIDEVDGKVNIVDDKVDVVDGKVNIVDDKVDNLLSEFDSGGTITNIYTAVQSLDTPPVAY